MPIQPSLPLQIQIWLSPRKNAQRYSFDGHKNTEQQPQHGVLMTNIAEGVPSVSSFLDKIESPDTKLLNLTIYHHEEEVW